VKTCDSPFSGTGIRLEGRPNFRLLPQILALISPAQDDIPNSVRGLVSISGNSKCEATAINAFGHLANERDATALPAQAIGRAIQRSKAAIRQKNLRAS
jgi:hypothetical protein